MTEHHESKCSGILLHISSLPSRYGVGDFGPSAFEFVDSLKQASQSLWQILPINPTSFGNSPYSCTSAFAINPLFVSPEFLVRDGLLEESDLASSLSFSSERVQYSSVLSFKLDLLTKSFEQFSKEINQDAFERFCVDNSYWLDEFCLFSVIKHLFEGIPWSEWPDDIKKRKPETIKRYLECLREAVEKEKFIQYVLYSQWNHLKEYCEEKEIRVFGDVALYVNHDSADVWAHPELFKLDDEFCSTVVAGVPPDYFSETGQKWGNPVFNWSALSESDYEWWIERLKHNLKLFDLVRIDHFRGFLGAWEIPAEDPTAVNGQWQKCPGDDFFSSLVKKFKSIPVVAEDLGVITQDVKDVMKKFGFPGMKLLIFAFDGDISQNPYAPSNHVKNCVLYTGTHDCNTIRGWFEDEASDDSIAELESIIGEKVGADTVSEKMISLAMSSIADTVILPMQDVLGLSSNARMNCPGIPEGNWEWRLLPGQWSNEVVKILSGITNSYERS